jgi:hypothetical protein
MGTPSLPPFDDGGQRRVADDRAPR